MTLTTPASLFPLAMGTRVSAKDAPWYLEQRRLPLHLWGKRPAKNIGQLQDSLETEQVELWDNSDTLQLYMNVAVITVVSIATGRLEILKEHQRICDGIPYDGRNMFDGSVSETYLIDEDRKRGHYRGLEEELHIPCPSRHHLHMRGVEQKGPMQSPDHYPGLTVVYYRYKSVFWIKRDLYQDTYVNPEPEKNRVTVFKWFSFQFSDPFFY